MFLQVNDTRVILDDADPDVVGSDYINANYVKVSLHSRFIVTQNDNNTKQETVITHGDISVQGCCCLFMEECSLVHCVFVEQPVGVRRSESLHCHPGVPSNNYQRFLADGMAGEDESDRHDNKRGRERAGQYQNNSRDGRFGL